jgi:uncharacterized protein YcnI
MVGRRTGMVAAGAGAICVGLLIATPAFAHVGVSEDEIVAGASTSLSFSFGHGCEDSPTNSMKFQVPEGIVNAVPQVHAGWDIEVEREELAEPVEGAHGGEVTDRPAVITFTAREGFEVPNGQRDTMTLNFTAPETEGQVFFPVIQGCVAGTNDWIAQWDGSGAEPDNPAPSVMVVAENGDDEHGHDADGAAGADEVAVTETTIGGAGDVSPDTDADAEDDGSEDDSSNALAIAGVVLGAAGLGVGGTALAKSRRRD